MSSFTAFLLASVYARLVANAAHFSLRRETARFFLSEVLRLRLLVLLRRVHPDQHDLRVEGQLYHIRLVLLQEAAQALRPLTHPAQLRQKPAVNDRRVAALAVERRHRDEVRCPNVVLDQALNDPPGPRLVDVEDNDSPRVVDEGFRARSE